MHTYRVELETTARFTLPRRRQQKRYINTHRYMHTNTRIYIHTYIHMHTYRVELETTARFTLPRRRLRHKKGYPYHPHK